MKTLVTILLLLLPAGLAKPSVVTSIAPYADLLGQIAGDGADVTALLKPGSSPHTYDPSPQDLARVAGADLVVLNGGLDAWVQDLVRAGGSRARVLVAMSVIPFEPVTGEAGQTGGSAGMNPHIWLDPVLMARLVPHLVAALSEADPAGAAGYRARGDALSASLNSLDAELESMLAPVRGAAFVPFHDAWPYFARRYGLNLVAVLEPSPGREPGPRAIAGVIDLLRRADAGAVFAEAQLPKGPAEVVARGAGVELAVLDPLGEAGQSYQQLLVVNARTIVAALDE